MCPRAARQVPGRGLGFAAATALLAAAVMAAAALLSLDLRPGTSAWRRVVGGPTADGILYPAARAVLVLPDLARHRSREVELRGSPIAPGTSALAVSVDGAPPLMLSLGRQAPARIAVPARTHAGLRLEVRAVRGAPPPRIEGLRVTGVLPAGPTLWLLAAAAGALVFLVASVDGLGPRAMAALAVTTAGLLALATALLGDGGLVAVPPRAVVLGLVLLLAGLAAGFLPLRARAAGFPRAALIVAAFVCGGFVRAFFLPSPGSWDVEYWRAWTEHSLSGLATAYGPPLAAGELLPQLTGRAPLWMVERDGRTYPIDYPPFALLAWQAGGWLTGARAGAHPGWNAALKLPAVAGDVLAVLLLLALRPRSPRQGLATAAAYWVFPGSWLSSAVLGYLDGAYAPLVLLAAWTAGRGRSALTGAALAVAALVKPTALLAAPACAVALRTGRRLAIGAAAGALVVALALVPFAMAGTLGTAAVHMARILHQERLSGGFANLWWLASGALGGSRAPVAYVRLDATALPARVVGSLLLLAAIVMVCRALARRRGPLETTAAAGALVASYGVFAVGVHANHVHAMVLLLLAGGVWLPAWRTPSWILLATYPLNLLFLEGLGRLDSARYAPLADASAAIEWLRLGSGVDLTLLLALANVGAVALLLARSRAALAPGEGRVMLER